MEIDSTVKRLEVVNKDMRDEPPGAIKHKDSVLSEYKDKLRSGEIEDITEQEFKNFLHIENNHHWSGLHRMQSEMTKNMEKLRQGLGILVNQNKNLGSRVQTTKEMIDGMGKATMSAILVTAYPEDYGVWNNRSEEALKRLDSWPDFEYGSNFGNRYERVNEILVELSNELGVDLWDLDAILGYYVANEESSPEQTEKTGESGRFAKEKHLQQYLINQWDKVALSDQWQIYSDADDPEAGVEYSTGIGRPDILLTHTSGERVCVLELKKGRTSDRAVGQLLRYVGWVQDNIEELEDIDTEADIEGRLIVSKPTDKLEYAISVVPELTLHEYEMEVRLNQPDR